MSVLHMQEVSIAGIYFHWLVPLAFGGIAVGLLFKFIFEASGLIRFFRHHDLVVMAVSLGFCSFVSFIFISI